MPKQKTVLYSEAALVIIMILNSFAVDLMLYSGSGISAISSVTLCSQSDSAFFQSWNLDLLFPVGPCFDLMILRKRFVLSIYSVLLLSRL